MKEMSEQDRQTRDAARARRKHIAEQVARIVGLLAGFFWLLVFLALVRTGYLSSIGIAVGALLTIPCIIGSVAGLAGRKRLEKGLSWLWGGTIILIMTAAITTFIWPQGPGTWRPYRFDEELAAIETRRAVPDAENAAPRYESVFGKMHMDDEPNFVFSGASSIRDELWRGPWKSTDYPQAAEWFDSQSSAINDLLEIGRMEKCRWPVQADTYDEYTVPYKKLRPCMLLLIAAGNRDLGENRATAALTKYFCTLKIADHIHQQPSKVDCLMSLGCERDGLRMIRYVLVQSPLSDEDVAQIAGHLPPAADPWPEEWERLLEHEKLHYMNLLGRLYEINDDGAVRFAASPAFSPKEGTHAGRFPRFYWLMSMPRDPHAVRGIVDKYFAKFQHGVSSERLPQMDRHEQPPRASLNDFAKAVCNAYRWGFEMFFFNEREYMQHRQWRVPAITSRRGTWLILGLRRYHNAHGTWPQTLDRISEYVPPDALLDPTADEAFVYVPDGDSFKLYSKGPNRVDEGGRNRYLRALKKSEDDISIWPPPVPEPEPESDSLDEEMREQLEKAYGKDYVENLLKNDGSKKR
jgi:hypothetical protein